MTLHRISGPLIVAVCCCLLSTGCASLAMFPAASEEPASAPALRESPEAAMYRAIQTARQTGAIVVQIEGAEKPLKVLPLPTDGSTVFVSSLIRQMDLKRRFRGLDITLFRSTGQVMDGVKMAVTFDKSGRVTTGTDYALRPGDRVTVRRQLHSAMQSIVDGLVPSVVHSR